MFVDPPVFDSAIVGVAERCGQPPLVVYDREICLMILEGQGMSEEFFDFNMAGAWVGPYTPLFLSR